MENITRNFSSEEHRIIHTYCTNYCSISDETRKTSIKIFIDLYKHRILDIQEHNLDNVFLSFYQKQREFALACRVPECSPDKRMRLRFCSDIIAFLEDLEKIYSLLRKKGIEINYILILGEFLRLNEEEHRRRLEELLVSSAREIDAVVSPIQKKIEGGYREDAVRTPTILRELISFVKSFNSLSPGLTINDEMMTLLSISLLGRFGNERSGSEIAVLLDAFLEQVETDEFESALQERPCINDIQDPDMPLENFHTPLRILHERLGQTDVLSQLSREILSSLEVPGTSRPQVPSD